MRPVAIAVPSSNQGPTQRITTVQVSEEQAPLRTEPVTAAVPAQWGGLQLLARGSRTLAGVNRRFLASLLVKPGQIDYLEAPILATGSQERPSGRTSVTIMLTASSHLDRLVVTGTTARGVASWR